MKQQLQVQKEKERRKGRKGFKGRRTNGKIIFILIIKEWVGGAFHFLTEADFSSWYLLISTRLAARESLTIVQEFKWREYFIKQWLLWYHKMCCVCWSTFLFTFHCFFFGPKGPIQSNAKMVLRMHNSKNKYNLNSTN